MPALDSKLLASLSDPQIDAMVEVMLLAAAADGHLDESELKQLRQSLLEVDDLWLSHVDLDQRVAAATQRLGSAPRSARLAALKNELPNPEQRLAALELALRVITADGVIRTAEHDLVLEVSQLLEIDGKVAADLVIKRLY